MYSYFCSDPFSKRISDAEKAQSSVLKDIGSLSVYQVVLEEKQSHVSGCRFYRFGKETPKPNRTILLMGATGAGKSTLIDGMVNYIFNVCWEDEHRFKLVREVHKKTQTESQTPEVTVYKLNHLKPLNIDYSLTIIDIPEFGDSRGIVRDMEITQKIRHLFMSKADLELDAVCFVVQAASVRLTPSQRYVLDSVLSIFGKDIAENIRILVTFADGQRPPVLEVITASGVPCPKENGAPLHFKFNNSALFISNTSVRDEDGCFHESFDQMFWNVGHNSMQRFFVALNQIRTKSLTLTKVVLSERKQLENLVKSLQKQVRVGLSKLKEIKQTSEVLLTLQAEINRNAKFDCELTVTEPLQVDISGSDKYITNCQQCSFTCHYPCDIVNGEDMRHCPAMGQDGHCTMCPGKCMWSVHFNQKYRWEYRQVIKKQTIQELKEKYEKATGEKNAAEVVLNKLEDEYEDVHLEVTVMVDRLRSCLNRLKEISLKQSPLYSPDDISMLIEGEKAEAKPGWSARVESLMELKERAEIVAKVDRGESLLGRNQRTRASFMARMMAQSS